MIELFSWVSMLNERSRLLAQQVALLRDTLDRHVAGQQDARVLRLKIASTAS